MTEPFTPWHPSWLDDPEFQKEYAAEKRKWRRLELAFGWTKRIPYIGGLIFTFWFTLLDEGVYQTCKPRWGALTFAYLNDGFRPTLWHTWYGIVHGSTGRYSGIYIKGAPRSRREAEAIKQRGWRGRGDQDGWWEIEEALR